METETLTVAERTCKDCGTPLGAGRDDRMYCDEFCKTNFNNRKKREIRKAGEGQTGLIVLPSAQQLSVPDYITRIQEILLNNRRILEGLCNPEKPRRVEIQQRRIGELGTRCCRARRGHGDQRRPHTDPSR